MLPAKHSRCTDRSPQPEGSLASESCRVHEASGRAGRARRLGLSLWVSARYVNPFSSGRFFFSLSNRPPRSLPVWRDTARSTACSTEASPQAAALARPFAAPRHGSRGRPGPGAGSRCVPAPPRSLGRGTDRGASVAAGPTDLQILI